MDKQNLRAGDNSNNIQAEKITVVMGVDEKRAREVYQEMSLKLKEEFAQEALKVANERVSELESILLPKIEKIDGAFEAFADPSFQILLSEAQKTAASTERPADYDLLSELLIHRFQKGNDRVIRAGINRAVEIVDEISDDALLGLTVIHVIDVVRPKEGRIYNSLKALNNLFGKILYTDLPSDNDWLDHLDILDAIRISPSYSLKNLEMYYDELLHGYIDVGVEKNSEDFVKALDILEDNQLSKDNLIEHEFNSNFMRIPVWSRNFINQSSLPKNQKEALNNIYDLYSKDCRIRKENSNKFMEEWNNLDNLRTIKEWWDSLSIAVDITSVGRVLAHSNAQRCDKSIPPID